MRMFACLAIWLLVAARASSGLYMWKPLRRPVDYRITANPLRVRVSLETNSSLVHTVFTYKSRWLSCEDEVSLNYTLTVYNKDHHLLREERVDLQKCDSPFRLTLSGLQRDRAYNAYLTVKSDDNSYSFKSKEVYFTTTGVQSAYIIKGNHHVQIICLLSAGSTARGCEVSVQLRNTQSTVGIETQVLDVYRSGLMVAERCVRLPRTLAVSSVQVYDWTEDGERGEVALPSTIIDSVYAPCYVESISSKAWKETSHLILFTLSASFMVLGTAIILVGMLCRMCQLHRHFRRDSHKALDGDSVKHPYSSFQKLTLIQ